MDEMHWRLMEKGGSHRWWTWCVASEDAAVYWIRGQRSREAARRAIAAPGTTTLPEDLT
jgi:hypothetical protein